MVHAGRRKKKIELGTTTTKTNPKRERDTHIIHQTNKLKKRNSVGLRFRTINGGRSMQGEGNQKLKTMHGSGPCIEKETEKLA